MTQLRILVVADVSALSIEGGSERVLREQTWRLAARGHDVRVLSRATRDGTPRVELPRSVPVHHFDPDSRSAIRFVLRAMLHARRAADAILRDAGADVLEVHQPLGGYGALTARDAHGLPSLYTFHSAAPLEYRSRARTSRHHHRGPAGVLGALVLKVVEGACLRRASMIRVLSDFSAGELRRLYRIPWERIVKIPGGVDAERFHPIADRGAVRKELGVPVDGGLLLTVRNLEPRMGLDALIRAMAPVVRHRPDAVLVVGGSGSQREELESLVRDLGLGASVRFLGFVAEANLPRWYQAADVFVLPTRELEGFGLVTVEALACGTPVLGTAVGATPELLAPLDAGLVFHDTSPAGMAARIVAFLDAQEREPAAAARLRETCRRHAAATYSWDRVVDGLEDALDGLVRARSRR